MKRIIYITVVLLIVFLIPNSYAHPGNVNDHNNKKSLKVNECEGNFYGYHVLSGEYHFHQVKWDDLLLSWHIVEPKITYEENPCTLTPQERFPVKFKECVDGDTVKFELNKEIITARLLAIDTPELKQKNEQVKSFAYLAKEFTCNVLANTKSIEIEYDLKSSKVDKYGRHLVWVFTDQGLFQESLVRNGFAKVAYLYDRYKYTPSLQVLEEEAATKKIGIWRFTNEELGNVDDSSNTAMSEDEKWQKRLYIALVIIFSIVAIVKELRKK